MGWLGRKSVSSPTIQGIAWLKVSLWLPCIVFTCLDFWCRIKIHNIKALHYPDFLAVNRCLTWLRINCTWVIFMSDLNQNCIHFRFELHLFNTILRAVYMKVGTPRFPSHPVYRVYKPLLMGRSFLEVILPQCFHINAWQKCLGVPGDSGTWVSLPPYK